jgi:hypothetical protein
MSQQRERKKEGWHNDVLSSPDNAISFHPDVEEKEEEEKNHPKSPDRMLYVIPIV